MKVWLEDVSISVEVILYNDDLRKIIVLSKSKKQLEYKDKQVIPLYSKGRLIDFNVQYEGEYYKSFVAGLDKLITSIGHVVECNDVEEVLKAIKRDEIVYVSDDIDIKSDIIILFIQ